MAVKEEEQRVWQRVMDRDQPEHSGLRQLAIQAQQAASQYRRLLKSRVESHRELGKQLLATELENLAALKGLHYMQTGKSLKLPAQTPMMWDTKQILGQYHIARRMLSEYTARSAEPEWGCVFLAMAKRQEQQCDRLCRLMGHMQ